MQIITTENWSSTMYKSLKLQAFISFGASVNEDFIYYLTVTDNDFNEVMQTEYIELSEALSQINKKYCHWELVSRSPESEGGCGDCAAH